MSPAAIVADQQDAPAAQLSTPISPAAIVVSKKGVAAAQLSDEEDDLSDDNVLENELYLNEQQAMIDMLRKTCPNNLTGQKCRIANCPKTHVCINFRKKPSSYSPVCLT